jgi:cytochrome c553
MHRLPRSHRVKTYRSGYVGTVAVCVRCHGNYMKHHRWLPHAELHFMYLEVHLPQSALQERLGFQRQRRRKGRQETPYP